MAVGGAHLAVDVVKGGKNGQGKIHMPDRDVIIRRTRAAGNRRHQIAERFVRQPVDIKYVYRANEKKQEEKKEEQPVMFYGFTQDHTTLAYHVFSFYNSERMNTVDEVVFDIQSLKIQGATNVALAVLDTLAKTTTDAEAVGMRLAYARPTEPLAQNALRYVFANHDEPMAARIRKFRKCITEGKTKIVENGKHLFVDGGSYLTLCHSSTVISLLGAARAQGASFSLFVAETRPLFQGRTTATELLSAGFDDVTMVIDDVAVSLIEGRKGNIDAVFIGADLLSEGGFVNKVGSLAVATAAAGFGIPVYSVTTLLKYDPRPFDQSIVESRGSEEIWPDAPKNLRFYAPAFDYVPYRENVYVVCESGVLRGDEVKAAASQAYPFIVS